MKKNKLYLIFFLIFVGALIKLTYIGNTNNWFESEKKEMSTEDKQNMLETIKKLNEKKN